MIKFNLEVKPVWVDGSIEDFNTTEIGDSAKKERRKIRLMLRPIFPGKQRELREANTHQDFAEEIMNVVMKKRKSPQKFPNTPKNRAMIEEILRNAGVGVKERFDEVGYNQDLIDEAIGDWQGMIDVEGNEIPCTRENKTTLFYDGGYTAMGLVILSLASRLAVRHDLYEMEKEKNLQSSQGGKQLELMK